tara:strand:- start:36 stop:1028 length:993 start_codon:yes stop_codon:yes gene_type:complete
MKINKILFYRILIDWPIIFFVVNRETNKLGTGDASNYQKLFKLVISGEEWSMAAGSEPVWLFLVKLSSFFGEYALIFFISLIILFLIYQTSKFLNLQNIVSRIFIILLIFPSNTIGLFLCNAWRTTLSLLLLISFFLVIYSKRIKQKFIKSSILLLPLIMSHSSGPIIGTLFISIKEILLPFFKSIRVYKLKKITLLFSIIASSIALIAIPFLLKTSYVTIRLGEYFQESRFSIFSNETKPLSTFALKIIILIFIELFFYFFKKNQRSLIGIDFHLTMFLLYLIFLFTGIFIDIIISDRLVNCLYWITFLSLIDININLLKNNLILSKFN